MSSDSGSERRGAAALVVGNEILLGKTRDTNTLYLADFLMKKGIKLQRWVIVPDREDHIVTSLRRLVDDRFDLIFVSGGMGPTHDDITVESISKALNLPLVRSEKANERMISKWHRRNPGKDLPGNAEVWLKKMSLIPKGFSCIENDAGMAEGLTGEVKDSLIFVLPGVPGEYRSIVDSPFFSDIIPDHEQEELRVEEILFRGRESQIAEYLSDLQNRNPDLEIGSYPQGRMNVIVRITGSGKEIDMILQELEKEVERLEDENERTIGQQPA